MPRHFNIDTTYGIELEFKTPLSQGQIATALRAAGINAEATGYTHRTTTSWKILRDASVCGGWEIVSPILSGEAGFEDIRTVCATLQNLGCTVDRQCGMHLHLGATNEDFGTIQRFAQNYAKLEDSIDCLVPPSRRFNNNSMIQSLSRYTETDTEETVVRKINQLIGEFKAATDIRGLQQVLARRCYGDARYHKLNLEAYTRHGTVEVRQHAGTLDADKVEHWVRLFGALFASSRASRSVAKRKVSGQTAKFRLKWLFEMTIQGETRRFMGRRARKLAA